MNNNEYFGAADMPMTEQQIKDEILRYLRDTSYNYAVLIDGEWGSGKTYFVTNTLSAAIAEQENGKDEPRPVKYISLYGCKSIVDIQENIAWSFAENARKKIKEKANWDTTGEKASSALLLCSKKIGNAILKKYLPETSVYEIASDWLNLGSYIFVFDDLERCDCPLNEVFGFLNELVEHESTKVILIANEKELSDSAEAQFLEFQYQLTLDDRIDWPKKEENIFSRLTNHNSQALTLDEMERRRMLLFPAKAANSSYRKIREKLIGVTLKYEPDIPAIVSEIIESSDCDETCKTILREKRDSFSSTMQFYHHKNIRTFQFFLSKVRYLFEALAKIDLDTDYCDQICNRIVTEAFSQAVKFKSNYQPPRDTTTWLRSEQETSFQSIKVYIETGIFEQKVFEEEILKLKNELSAHISYNDPYNLIYQQYFLHSQEWCEKHLDEMLHQLEDNKYPISFYAKIIVAIQRLIDLGFDQVYMQRAKAAMLNNITRMGELAPIDPDLWFVDDREFKENVASIVADINSAIKDHSEIASRKTVEDILDYSDWVGRLEKYINPTQSSWFPSIAVFSKAPAEKWVAVINKATPEIIYNFRHLLGKVYPSNEKQDCYSIDADTIHQIFDAISKMEPNDLIKKASLVWLHFQFDEIIKLHEPEVTEETGLMRSE